MRVWAEPETGGEAYIPLAASKRGRSRMVASDVVARLGGAVSWSSARLSGGGAVSAAPTAASGLGTAPLIGVANITQAGGTPDQIAGELMFQLRARG